MDKIWDRKSSSKSEVIDRCDGDENSRMTEQTDKSRTLNIFNMKYACIQTRSSTIGIPSSCPSFRLIQTMYLHWMSHLLFNGSS